MLTRKQQELLLYIHQHLGEGGVSPSFDEMKDALGLKSKSGIHRLITGLEERGFIRRLPHRARALEVLRLPDVTPAPKKAAAAAPADVEPRFKPNVIKADFQAGLAGRDPGDAVGSVSLPLYGRIAAGLPIEAMRDSGTIDIPVSMLGIGEHYALEVAGDSMVDAGIHDGDTVIIQRCETAENGAIVVALVDAAEVTLKRLRRKNNSIALEPANPNYETRVFGADRVRVQGRLVGLFRRY
ncbi:transcriptional repressor LexA [Azospirillum sp. B4]|uniref:transcriptional repressor LexA n=1 Tax=Azospirillum sp. B4 TaxID=95605 RepID=UPI000349854B|nr:transcriptional repressor LexA [Azospirillum sp. B4]